MAELTVDNLHLTYGDNPILKGVSLTLNRGEVVSLLGPVRQRQDHAAARGRRPRGAARGHHQDRRQGRCSTAPRGIDVPAEGRNLGLVFQSYALWPHKTVFDNVAYGLKLRKIGNDEIGTRVDARRSTQLSLGHLAERFPHQLSGRPAAAGRARARARLQPAGDPARRAAVEPRRQAARGGARVAARADRADATLGAVRDARPERGAGDVGPHPAAQQRPDRAAGHAAADVQRSGRRCSPPISWAATTA